KYGYLRMPLEQLDLRLHFRQPRRRNFLADVNRQPETVDGAARFYPVLQEISQRRHACLPHVGVLFQVKVRVEPGRRPSSLASAGLDEVDQRIGPGGSDIRIPVQIIQRIEKLVRLSAFSGAPGIKMVER